MFWFPHYCNQCKAVVSPDFLAENVCCDECGSKDSRTKYIPWSNCVYDCDLFITIDRIVVTDAYLSRAGGPKDHQAAAKRYGIQTFDSQTDNKPCMAATA